MPNISSVSIFGQVYPPNIGWVASFGYFEYDPPPDGWIADLVPRMIALIVEQFESSQNLLDFFAILLDPGQEIESTLYQLLEMKSIDKATGHRLDIAGAIVGQSRNYQTDDIYRQAIYARIQLNKSNGEPELVIETLRILTKATRIHYMERHPACIILTYYASLPIPVHLLSTLVRTLERVALAGVKILLQFTVVEEPDFAFQSEGGFPEIPFTSGFSETNYLEDGKEIGGQFVELIVI